MDFPELSLMCLYTAAVKMKVCFLLIYFYLVKQIILQLQTTPAVVFDQVTMLK